MVGLVVLVVVLVVYFPFVSVSANVTFFGSFAGVFFATVVFATFDTVFLAKPNGLFPVDDGGGGNGSGGGSGGAARDANRRVRV